MLPSALRGSGGGDAFAFIGRFDNTLLGRSGVAIRWNHHAYQRSKEPGEDLPSNFLHLCSLKFQG